MQTNVFRTVIIQDKDRFYLRTNSLVFKILMQNKLGFYLDLPAGINWLLNCILTTDDLSQMDFHSNIQSTTTHKFIEINKTLALQLKDKINNDLMLFGVNKRKLIIPNTRHLKDIANSHSNYLQMNAAPFVIINHGKLHFVSQVAHQISQKNCDRYNLVFYANEINHAQFHAIFNADNKLFSAIDFNSMHINSELHLNPTLMNKISASTLDRNIIWKNLQQTFIYSDHHLDDYFAKIA